MKHVIPTKVTEGNADPGIQFGLRPVELWVPDTLHPDFADECRRQSRLVAQADSQEDALDAMTLMATIADLREGT